MSSLHKKGNMRPGNFFQPLWCVQPCSSIGKSVPKILCSKTLLPQLIAHSRAKVKNWSSCSPASSSTMSWVVSVSNYCGWERRFCIPKTHNCNIEHNSSSSSYFTIWDNVVWYLPIFLFLRDCHDRLMMTFYLEKPTKIVKHKGNLLWKLLNEDFFFLVNFVN